MRKTTVGRFLGAAAFVSFVIAFLQGTLAPAFLGIALLALTEGARRHVRRVDIRVTRRLPRQVALGARFDTHVEATSTLPVPIFARDSPPPGLRILRRKEEGERGRSHETLRVEARDPGQTEWTNVLVEAADPWGIFAQQQTIKAPAKLAIVPEPLWGLRGRRVGRRHTIRATVRARSAFEPSPEIETIRPYEPRDRVRDIDWARSSREIRLFSKQRQRVGPRPILILLDATSTMRDRRRVAKITTASRLCGALQSAAQAAGVRAELVAFTDERVLGAPSRTKAGRSPDPLATLASLDPPVPQEFPRLADPQGDVERDPKHPREKAVRLLTGPSSSPQFVAAILDAELRPRASERMLRRLADAGHQVVLIAPATGTHHFRRPEARGKLLLELARLRVVRNRLERKLRPRRIPMIAMAPTNLADVVEEVARWAQ